MSKRTGLSGEAAELAQELVDRGWQIDRITGSGHLKLSYPPTGGSLVMARSPSDHRATRNTRARARRIESGRPVVDGR